MPGYFRLSLRDNCVPIHFGKSLQTCLPRLLQIAALLLTLIATSQFARADDSADAREKADKAFQKSDFASAIGYYTITVSLDPHDASAFFSRGASYANMASFLLRLPISAPRSSSSRANGTTIIPAAAPMKQRQVW